MAELEVTLKMSPFERDALAELVGKLCIGHVEGFDAMMMQFDVFNGAEGKTEAIGRINAALNGRGGR